MRSHLSNDIFFSLISMKLDVEILITLFNFFDDVDGTVLENLTETVIHSFEIKIVNGETIYNNHAL